MMLHIADVIDSAQMGVIRRALAEAPFVDGKLSAGMRARRVKDNREVERSSEISGHLSKIVLGNLHANAAFRNAALPHRVATPFFAKYEPGMTYGEHIDDPVMGETQRFRCDIALTLFLSAPEEYDGGELVVRTTFGEQKVKLPAGDAVLYPASSLHRVAPVTRGARLVAVTWIQSLIRDAGKREVLYELGLARDTLLGRAADAPETAHVDHAYTNLVRMWADV